MTSRYFQCEIAHVTLTMFRHWLERDWGWQIFDLPSYAWPELCPVDYGHADEFECYYDLLSSTPDEPRVRLGRIWLAQFRTERLYLELFVEEQNSWARRLDLWLQQRYGVQLSDAKRKLMIAPAPAVARDQLAWPRWEACGYTEADYFDWWYRGGRLGYATFSELAAAIGVDVETLLKWHEEGYRRRYGPRPMPNSQSHFSDIL